MFFSKLGPAIAAHSACKKGRASVRLMHNPRAPTGTVFQHQIQPSSPMSRHSNTDCTPAPNPFPIPTPMNTNLSVLPVAAGCDLDAEGGASGRDPAYTFGR